VLWQIQDGRMIRFRCRVGHAFSAESLLASQSDGLETALWSAMRALEEKASLTRRLAERATERSQPGVAERFGARADEAEAQADIIRRVLLDQRRESDSEESERQLARRHAPAS
jgi:two-component system chemotaxis response regulator CheB